MPELNTAPADSALDGSEKLLTLGFENLTLQQAANFQESKGTNIASAATVNIGAATGPYVHITGTTTITAFDSIQAGTERTVVFDGILTLTHNGTSLILPTGANITTAAGDAALFRSEGSGDWRCVGYMRKSGAPIAGGGGDFVGPASSVANRIVVFDGTTGKLGKDGGKTIADLRAPAIQAVTSSATVTPTFSDDMVKITAQAAALALANPTGTAIPGLGMVIRIKDNGTARAISYDTQYRAIGITLPTTTFISKTTYIAMIYNSDDTKWDCVATGTEA